VLRASQQANLQFCAFIQFLCRPAAPSGSRYEPQNAIIDVQLQSTIMAIAFGNAAPHGILEMASRTDGAPLQ